MTGNDKKRKAPIDDIDLGIQIGIDNGYIEIAPPQEDGKTRYKLTEAGTKYIESKYRILHK